MKSHFDCAALITAFILALPAGAIAGNRLPQVSPDGLKLMNQDEFAAVYLRDGVALSDYDKVVLVECTVEFRKNWKRDQNEDIPFSVKDKDVDRIKTGLAAEFSKVFSEELSSRGETIVTDSGQNTLVLRPAIVNLDISVPDAMERIDEVTLTASAGQMTLYLEIYDSLSNTLLARIMDPEESRDFGNFMIRNEVTNLADADLILKKWADTLGDYLAKARDAGNRTP